MKVTLDDLRTEADHEYQPVELVDGDGTAIVLQSLLLIHKDKRAEFKRMARKLQNEAADGDLDEGEVMVDLLALVADDPRRLRKLLTNESAGTLYRLFQRYMETAQPGEASGSPT